ncbi:MAG: hypothetical protein AMXMBFR33_43240 [Candidatus Xenobia bacterium]
MQVTQIRPHSLHSSSPATPPPPASQAPPVDDRFAWSGDEPVAFTFPSFASQPDELPAKLPEENPPVLDRPVLLVHGYNGAAENWQAFEDWLTRDGINPNGGNVKGDGTSQVNPEGRVFKMQFQRPYNSVATNASELRAAVNQICRATGAAEVDLIAHSKGGLDSRLYLDQGDERVRHLVMIGTPNHGTVMADLELRFRELGLPIFPPFQDPEVNQALRDLSADRMGADGRPNNPVVRGLNQNLQRQKERAELFTVDGNGVPTLSDRNILTFRGDGVISRSSVELPGVERSHKWWVNHTQVKAHADVLRKTVAFITDQPLPADEPEPPDVPADQEITPIKISADPEKLEYLIAARK